jgi:hypothetical protein
MIQNTGRSRLAARVAVRHGRHRGRRFHATLFVVAGPAVVPAVAGCRRVRARRDSFVAAPPYALGIALHFMVAARIAASTCCSAVDPLLGGGALRGLAAPSRFVRNRSGSHDAH